MNGAEETYYLKTSGNTNIITIIKNVCI